LDWPWSLFQHNPACPLVARCCDRSSASCTCASPEHTSTVVPAAFMRAITLSTRRNGLMGFAMPAVAPAHIAIKASGTSGVSIETTGRVPADTACSRFAAARIIATSSAYAIRCLTRVGSSLSSTTIVCLDWVIPLSEAHLRTILRSWVKHCNRGRPHMGLSPGIPDARSRGLRNRLRAIAADIPTLCAPIRSSEDSITSTHWWPRDPFSGSDSNFWGSHRGRRYRPFSGPQRA
jgi:hypothetical protein